MNIDLVIANARIAGGDGTLTDIGITDGRIVVIQPAIEQSRQRADIAGKLVVPGFIESHIHLDKSNLLDVCRIQEGGLREAVEQVARAKRGFTVADVYARAAKTLERAILHGTTRMRTHIEVDPRVGLTSLHALKQLKVDYAWAIDLELCVFPQEGLIDDPGCEDVLISALQDGATVIGGAPYMDRDSHAHIAKIFALARRFDVDVDLHLDFSLDPSHLDLIEVCRLTDAYGWGGRVAIGHVTKLSSVAPERLDSLADLLAAAGVALTVLPATDLFLMGRDREHDVPRGVAPAHKLLSHGVVCSLSTNNVLNPFTPYGDCSLLRMANLYANVAHLGTSDQKKSCLDMITVSPARLMRIEDYGIAAGMPADVVVLDCETEAQAIAEIAPVLCGYKRGRQTFARDAGHLIRPA